MANSKELEEKARKALAECEIKRIYKDLMLMFHYESIEMIKTFNLPYRVNLDALKSPDHEHIGYAYNILYPLPGYPAEEVRHFSPEELPTKSDLQEIEAYCAKKKPWNLETKEGFKKWEYQFAHFLGGYNLDSFSAFDFFGTRLNLDELAPEPLEQIKYWKSLQKRFKRHPDAFRQHDPEYKPEYKELYSSKAYVIDNYTEYLDQHLCEILENVRNGVVYES